jgi:hypothetical protein
MTCYGKDKKKWFSGTVVCSLEHSVKLENLTKFGKRTDQLNIYQLPKNSSAQLKS